MSWQRITLKNNVHFWKDIFYRMQNKILSWYGIISMFMVLETFSAKTTRLSILSKFTFKDALDRDRRFEVARVFFQKRGGLEKTHVR